MIDYLELRTQLHLMDAEGSADSKPSNEDVIQVIHNEGWECRDIRVSYDDLQGMWRFNAKITTRLL